MKKRNKVISIFGITLAISVSLPVMASADYLSGGRTSPTFTAYYDSSVASYGYTPHFDAGRNAWAYSIYVRVNKSSSNSSSYDEYYVGNTTDTTLLGLTIPYKDGPWYGTHEPASATDTWKYCTVSLYDNTMKSGNFGYYDSIGVATHEIGHSLSLAHTTSPYTSVMFYATYAGNPTYSPTTYDWGQLKSKWQLP